MMVYIQTSKGDNMFEEDFEELKFNGNRGRDAFVEEILDILEPVSQEEVDDTSELLEDS